MHYYKTESSHPGCLTSKPPKKLFMPFKEDIEEQLLASYFGAEERGSSSCSSYSTNSRSSSQTGSGRKSHHRNGHRRHRSTSLPQL
mmetsp:Transcript_72247/g.126338  ORF Transcript_72247/g.126338 Transcript_72247/m.126338 type:complete len:86 (+) Transcript_72247:2-259(+)